MGKVRKFLTSPKVSLAAFALAVVLLLFSSVGGARAALTYYSDTYGSRVQTRNIGVTLVENGSDISWRDYGSAADGRWDEGMGVLLEHMLEAEENGKKTTENLVVGKAYPEELCVRNSGDIGQYVRVILYRYWLDENGQKTEKTQEMSPEWINLNLVNSGNWLLDQDASTRERTVLYYNQALAPGATTPLFSDTLSIDNMVAAKVTQTEEKVDGGTRITTTYDYDGVTFCLEAEVDAVQEHNAKDAILSAWGRQVNVNDGVLSLR